MKKNNKKYTHITVEHGNGKDFLCPAGIEKKNGNQGVDLNVCFDKNVPGRYASRINIRRS